MDDQNDALDAHVLQGLYQHYLQQSVNLTEEVVRLTMRVAELEQRTETD